MPIFNKHPDITHTYMVEIIIAKHTGFCSGVKYSIGLLDKAIESNPGKKIAMYGPIVHNESVINHYKGLGIDLINSADEIINQDIVVTRAHGITKKEKDALEDKQVVVIDAVCPKIQKIRHNVLNDAEDGHVIIYYGKKGHPETEHILSYITGYQYLMISADAAYELKLSPEKSYSLYCQTTMDKDKFDEIANLVGELCKDKKINQCICPATINRQKAAKELAQEGDMMIVIGGSNSSNTRELYNICNKHTKTELINNSQQIKNMPFTGKIGITAGASTPYNDIKEVVTLIYS